MIAKYVVGSAIRLCAALTQFRFERAANGDSSETAFQPGSFMDIDDDVEDPRKGSVSSFFTAKQGSESILNMKI
ncbi:hypothetical protein Aduo_006890 [Ancylostoma duodenale]